MKRLTNNKLCVDLYILDNEASEEYKRSIKNKWNAKYQLVPPHTHRSNARLKHTSSQSSPLSLQISQEIYGTSYSHKMN